MYRLDHRRHAVIVEQLALRAETAAQVASTPSEATKY